jgi:hypothetical protein
LQEHADILLRLRRGDVRFGDRDVQRAPGVKELGLGAFETCLGGGLPAAALTSNFEELVDGEDRVITPVPDAVGSGRRVGWLSKLILVLERDSAGFGNSWATIFWAVAASTPAAAASKSQFLSKARRWESASESG